jgi:hypothetical protein
MINKYAFTNLFLKYLIPVLYAALYYFLQVEPNDRSYWQVIILLAGFYLGNLLLWADSKFLYNYYNELRTLPQQLITRSIVFLIAFAVLSIFMITSSGNLIGIGMILGIGVTLAIELWEHKMQPELFHKKFLFQVKRTFAPIEINRLIIGFSVFVSVVGVYFLFSRF